MRAWVLTVDQRSSRSTPDLVPAALAEYGAGALLAFERTAGDEIQGVFIDPPSITATLESLLRSGDWNVGIGHGEIEQPTSRSARAGRRTAYLLARDEQVETVLWLWAGLLGRRTQRGWEVAELLERGLTHKHAAEELGITQSAVTQRARAASVAEGVRCHRLVTQLLERMQATGMQAAEGSED